MVSLKTIIQPLIDPCLSMFTVCRWYNGSSVEWWCCSSLFVDAGEIDIYLQNVHFPGFFTVIGHKTWFNVMITTFENRCVSKNYLIVLRPIFDKTYTKKKTGHNIHVISTSRIGLIPTKWELISLCTREWYQRGHLGMDQIIYIRVRESLINFESYCIVDVVPQF